MTVVSVSRKKICDAIALEPTTTLNAGTWVHGETVETPMRSRECTVCAVGAVMRRALLHPNQSAHAIEDAAQAAVGNGLCGAYGNPTEEIKKGLYMSALSAFFEGEFADRNLYDVEGRTRTAAMNKLKKDCIKFVQKNFPAKVEIDIDGARPAKDVKVISSDDEQPINYND